MALNLPTVDVLPTPPTKTDPSNFAERADTFLDALPDFSDSVNTTIAELNKITSGFDQAVPIEEWVIGTTYTFPDVVAGSDGASYRCVATDVTGVDPTTDVGTNWMKLDGGGLRNTVVVSSDTTAIAKAIHILTAFCTLTLPALPPVNTQVAIYNSSGFKTCIVDPNGGKINGIAEQMTIDVLEISFVLMYTGVTYGWVVI